MVKNECAVHRLAASHTSTSSACYLGQKNKRNHSYIGIFNGTQTTDFQLPENSTGSFAVQPLNSILGSLFCKAYFPFANYKDNEIVRSTAKRRGKDLEYLTGSKDVRGWKEIIKSNPHI